MSIIGSICLGCAYCVHADHDAMKCYPNSKDCAKEYDLTEEDFHKTNNCDFFLNKEAVGN